MFFRILLLSITICSFGSSNAVGADKDSFFEPYVGATYARFAQNITNISGTVNSQSINIASAEASGDFSGVTGGLRVYKKFLNQFIIGGDAGLGITSGTLQMNLLTQMGNYKIVTFTPGLYVGWDIPTILFPRIWIGFYPFNSMSLSKDESSKSDSYGGHSYKFGFSFDWWIQLGVEFAKHTYTMLNGDKLPHTGTYNGLNMTQEKVSYEELILTISYPFSI